MSTMVDNLSELEQRVESLIQQIEGAWRSNAILREENARLQRELQQLSGAQDQNTQLLAESERLRHELESMSGREGLIRERLQGMLERIDAIEKEIQNSSSPGD